MKANILTSSLYMISFLSCKFTADQTKSWSWVGERHQQILKARKPPECNSHTLGELLLRLQRITFFQEADYAWLLVLEQTEKVNISTRHHIHSNFLRRNSLKNWKVNIFKKVGVLFAKIRKQMFSCYLANCKSTQKTQSICSTQDEVNYIPRLIRCFKYFILNNSLFH
jgi:hypothetical protein